MSSNPFRIYAENYRNNLPNGVTFDPVTANYFFNGKRFPAIFLVEWYRQYLFATTGFTGGFNPATLFANNEPGVWYDPSDLSTLFQDTAGTTPVTTPGQTVALMLDKSKGLTLGPELVTNGTFDTDTDWTISGPFSIAGGKITKTAGTVATFSQTVSNSAGSFCLIEFSKQDLLLFWSVVFVGSSSSYIIPVGSGTGSVILYAPEANMELRVEGGTNATGSLDNISVKELPGFHATQPTAAARPTYGIVPAGGRRNLLLPSNVFSGAGWTSVNGGVAPTQNATGPDGLTSAWTFTDADASSRRGIEFVLSNAATGVFTASVFVAKDDNESRFPLFNLYTTAGASTHSVRLNTKTGATFVTAETNASGVSVTDSGAFWRLSWSITALSGANKTIRIFPADSMIIDGAQSDAATGSIVVANAQLETGSTATPYQKVTTQFDVTEAGVESLGYLSFDGIDDWMVTPTITPGIDKVQVFAGVRLNALTSTSAIVELSASASSNNGSFFLYGENNSTLNFWSRGTTRVVVPPVVVAAPSSRALTGIGDISGDSAALRIDGTQVAQSTSDQGTGNYLAYPMYIGARAGTSFVFNGQIYSLITRFGDNLEVAQIESTEAYVAGKTAGVDL